MPEDEAKPVPTIILKLTDREAFNVQMEFETPNLEMARLMLNTAQHVIEKMQRDMEGAARAAAARELMLQGRLPKM